MEIGAVVIGRNEGERLRRCLQALLDAQVRVIVYVDSGSTDGSVEIARNSGVHILELDCNVPFTAARARNAGFGRLLQVASELCYVQFIDGDCEIADSWFSQAIAFLDKTADVAAVAGRLHERDPGASIYNWLCEREWEGAPGEARSCGGIAMMRVDAFRVIGGFREDMIAGEEPELCVRFRKGRWRVWRLDADMAVHDAAMTHFRQWWRRALRGGYAYAQGAHLHGLPPERHFVWETRRAVIWGIAFPLLCIGSGLTFGPFGWVLCVAYPIQVLRQAFRNPGTLLDRLTLALFQSLARFPESLGVIKFRYDLKFRRQTPLIEYK